MHLLILSLLASSSLLVEPDLTALEEALVCPELLDTLQLEIELASIDPVIEPAVIR